MEMKAIKSVSKLFNMEVANMILILKRWKFEWLEGGLFTFS